LREQDNQAAPVSVPLCEQCHGRADEAEQQLSKLALSGCQLSANVRIFGAGLPEAPRTDPKIMFEI